MPVTPTVKQLVIRNAVHDKIHQDLKTGSYSIVDCDLEKVYYPQENLEDLGAKPYIKVISVGFGADRDRTLRNSTRVLLSLPVQVAVQQRVDKSDTDYIDKIVQLVEEIMDALEDDELVEEARYTWQRTVPLKDENDLPYSYEQLTTQSVFQSIFTVYYQHIKDQ
jgi:hypothetical protein